MQLGPAEVRRELRLSATWRLRQRTGDRSPVTEQARQRERRFDGARDLVEHELEVTPRASGAPAPARRSPRGKSRGRGESTSRPAAPRTACRRATPWRCRRRTSAGAPTGPATWKRLNTNSTCQRRRYHSSTSAAEKGGSGKVVKTITYSANRSVAGCTWLPLRAASRRIFWCARRMASADLRSTQTRPATSHAGRRSSPGAATMVAQELTAPGRVTDDTAASRSNGRPPAVHSGSDPVFDTHNQPPARVGHVANAPRGRIAAVGQHMVAGADRELRQRFSRARPLGSRQLEEVARQRRQAHAVVQAPQRPARSRFLHRRRIHGPNLERGPRDDRQAPAPRTDGHTARATNPLDFFSRFSSATSDRSARCACRARTTVSRNECPQPRCSRRVRSRLSTALSLRSPFSAPVSCASSRQSCGRNDNRTSQSSSTAPASVSCIRRSGYAGHAEKTS